MKKKQLAPGDSTVVELTFKTKTYKTKISKAATIYTNDLTKSQVKIRVSANVDPVPDSTLPFTYTPDRLEFTPDDRKLEVVLTNTSKQTLNLTQVGDTYDGLSMKLGKDSLEPGKKTEIEFEWTGGFGKENFERSITFDVTGSRSTRFTVPFVVQGTDPAPVKKKPYKKKPGAKPVKTTSGKN